MAESEAEGTTSDGTGAQGPYGLPPTATHHRNRSGVKQVHYNEACSCVGTECVACIAFTCGAFCSAMP